MNTVIKMAKLKQTGGSHKYSMQFTSVHGRLFGFCKANEGDEMKLAQNSAYTVSTPG
jgi:hypothetical protein